MLITLIKNNQVRAAKSKVEIEHRFYISGHFIAQISNTSVLKD